MRTILYILALLPLCGCSIFQDFAVTVDKRKLVRNLAKNGIHLALTTVYDKDDEIEKRIEIARILENDIFKNAEAILSNGSVVVSEKTLDIIMGNIPEKMRPFLKSALDILKIARIDLSGVIGEYPSVLVRDFCYGIMDGCHIVINNKEE